MMSATLQAEGNNLMVLRVQGLLKKKELDTAIATQTEKFLSGTHVALLVIADGFEGFEQNEAWGDVSFFIQYGDLIDKIAIVANPRWKDDLMLFAAADFRRASVQFFPLPNIASARAWLMG